MTVQNADRLISRMQALSPAMEAPIMDALNTSADEMVALAIERVNENSGTGREYRRHGRTHIASSPGEYPNTDTGELVAEMRSEPAGFLAVMWSSFCDHLKPLELGTSRMAARPVLRPTFAALVGSAQARVNTAVKAVLGG